MEIEEIAGIVTSPTADAIIPACEFVVGLRTSTFIMIGTAKPKPKKRTQYHPRTGIASTLIDPSEDVVIPVPPEPTFAAFAPFPSNSLQRGW